MKAAVVTDFHLPLQVQELPVPEPAPGQVLVRLEFSGLCHTDIHTAHGDWPAKPTPPFTGTYDDYAVGAAAFACPVPDGVPSREAAPLSYAVFQL